ncbi:MAG: LCP family protein [Eubacteriales bacterium]|nr:LCP family protein [Eubacteriales bacterium]MDD3200039.1 LCP family protein [Eubacteriales bacterium]MDD4630022.1 LCP family protein [Eubacteriales bacterium]
MGMEIKRGNGTAARKQWNPAASFLRTFFIAFIVFLILCTPTLAFFDKVTDYNPWADGGNISLEEDLPVIIDENSPFFEAFKDKNRANVLILGVNANLTDTIMVASFDMDAKHVDLISIPRDTYYHRKGYNGDGENKLNAAYRGDPLNTAKAVNEILLGMPINYYAIVDYKGVETIVDSMGGVPMTIRKGGMYYKDPYDKPPLIISIPEGEQLLDGKQAVQFLRYRKGYLEGDLGRVKAQQEFMKSAFRQCISFDLPKIAKTVFNNVESDITLGAATKLATKAIGISGDDIETYMLPNTAQPDPPFYVIPDAEKTAEMIYKIYSIEPENTSEAAIN